MTAADGAPARRLRELEQGTTSAQALAFFDSLPAVAVAELTGAWRGNEVPTGHRLDGLLGAFGWRGKHVASPEDVHPLVFETLGSLYSINPAVVPLGVVLRFPGALRSAAAQRAFRLLRGALRTSRPRARLRMTEHRGVLTATMIYDTLPVHDVFRRVDADTVLGVMDARGMHEPFVFALRRDGAGSGS
ncbi:DUF4334 domain-containing protein [Georgenia sp. 10Sc9-8]|uniref:DUF4334 domain-containing protein n=1 Tax=Georgenia halotolerans TaxID=3028317 RepID=A0ABT5TU41_9MICO|nr:DUF4334 domain-containing protein [Georgenia halotolerans]